jgi:TPR repeat protein
MAAGHYDQVAAIGLEASPYDTELFKKLNQLEQLARSGNETAQYYEGVVNKRECRQLHGDAKSDAELSRADTCYKISLNWWLPLAQSSDPDSQWEIGQLYVDGNGVPKSPLNAIEWYYKAARGFQKLNNRERALMVLEDMREAGRKHPLTRKLSKQLLGSYEQ